MEVKEESFTNYNNWMDDRFERFSWGASDCHSYYRNAAGHAPFLFPGNYREFCKLHDASGVQEYQLG